MSTHTLFKEMILDKEIFCFQFIIRCLNYNYYELAELRKNLKFNYFYKQKLQITILGLPIKEII
jgi:N6-adenosine-specific RNA methylase IME4